MTEKRFIQARGAWTAKDNLLNVRLPVGHDDLLKKDEQGRLIYEDTIDLDHPKALNWLNLLLIDGAVFIRPSTRRDMHAYDAKVWGFHYQIVGYRLQKEEGMCTIHLVLGDKEECIN